MTDPTDRAHAVEPLRSAAVVITGVMAAGKSTVARLLAERLPRAAHVGGDAFLRMAVSGREDLTPRQTPEALAQLWLRYRATTAVADLYASAGWTSVVEDVVLGEGLADYLSLITTRPLYVVVLAPSAETVARRELGRPKDGYGPWTIEGLRRSLHEDTPRLGLWIDTSGQTPDETVDELLSRLDEARHRD